MNTKKFIIVISALFTVCCSACNDFKGMDPFWRITLHNTSNERTMLCSYSLQYPDTSVPAYGKFAGIGSKSVQNFDEHKSWEEVINITPLDTISFFFISLDTVDKYGWDNVVQQYRVQKRLDVDYKYLEEQDFQVYYP